MSASKLVLVILEIMYRKTRIQKAKNEEIYYVFFGFVLLAIAFIVILYLNKLKPHFPADDTKKYIYGTVISSHEDEGLDGSKTQYADVQYKVHNAIRTKTIEDRQHHRSFHDTMILEVNPDAINIVGKRKSGTNYARD